MKTVVKEKDGIKVTFRYLNDPGEMSMLTLHRLTGMWPEDFSKMAAEEERVKKEAAKNG